MFQKTLWPLGSVGRCLEGGRWAGLQSAASKSVVPGGCPLTWGPPTWKDSVPFPEVGRTDGAGVGAEPKLRLNLYVCVCVKPQKGERHRIAPKHGPKPSLPGFLFMHTQNNFPQGRASPPEHRERRPERRRPLPGSRDDLRRARTDVAPAQGHTLRRRP